MIYIEPTGLVRWGDLGAATLGLLGAGAGTVVGGALVAAPTVVSKVLGGAVLAKSIWSLGGNSYNFGRAISDDLTYDIQSQYQSLPRTLATGFSCDAKYQRLADILELGLDFVSGRAIAGFKSNPSGFLNFPIGYRLLIVISSKVL